jgi:flagellar motor switch protein FliN/FliY
MDDTTRATDTTQQLEMLLDIPVELTVEIGRARLTIGELLGLGGGSIVELTKSASAKFDVLINGKPIAQGEAVKMNDRFGVRLTEIISPSARLAGLK